MASTYLTRTPSSAGNRRTFTISVWFKRTGLDQFNYLFDADGGSTQSENKLGLVNDKLNFGVWNQSAGSSAINVETNRLFRDTNAWYHVVCAVDTTQSTASDRVKIYVNGVQETSFATATYPSQNYETGINATVPHAIGRWEDSGGRYFDGLMSHYHFCDGTALTPTSFGETDATTGIWKPKTAPSVTYGNNGFFLKFENSSSMGTDSSGNTNNFTVNGTMTQLIDTPSNVFATMNSLDNYYFSGTFANGNNTVTSNSSVESYITSTLAVSTGKYYWEIKISSSGSDRDFIGIGDRVSTAADFTPYSGNSNMISYYGYTGDSKSGSSTTNAAWGATFTTGDIIGVAMDLDNNKLYFSKNGTWQNSGDPTSGSTGTGALAIPTSPQDGVWYAQFANIHNTASTFQANFGNGYFGTTAVTSAENPDDGNGIFEYDVPAGYRALCTKSINAEEYS